MHLPRLQLFEFNDAPWVPPMLRETIIEALSRAIRWGGLVDGLVNPLMSCLSAAGTSKVHDLCAGAGGPAEALAEAARRRDKHIHFLLSDLQPAVSSWSMLKARWPAEFDFVAQSVDALAIPPGVGAGRVRMVMNGLHHFPPESARALLRAMCWKAPGVFIGESLVRNPMSFAAMAPVGIASLLTAPLAAPDKRLRRAALTWLTPIALAASAWDGTISSFRMYSPEEMRDMVSDIPGWEWSHGEYEHSYGVGRGSWFWGVPKKAA